MNKNAITITSVVVFHLAVITVMVVQPGCKSDGAKASAPEPVAATNTTASMPAPAPDNTQWSQPTRPPEEPPVPMAQYTPTSEPINAVNAIPAPPPAETTSVKTHSVVANDSLIKIARENGVTVDEILAANTATHLTRTTILQQGRQIVIPAHVAPAASMPATATAPEEGTYKVVSGDNLTKIAQKFGTTIAAIKAANGMTSDRVAAGQTLKIPNAAASATSAPSAPAAGEDEYIVQSGDNPDVIARKTGVRASEIMRLNNLTDAKARNLHVGDKLKLPSRSGPAPTTGSSAPTPVPTAAPVIATPAPAPVSAVPVTTGTDSPPVAPVAQ